MLDAAVGCMHGSSKHAAIYIGLLMAIAILLATCIAMDFCESVR